MTLAAHDMADDATPRQAVPTIRDLRERAEEIRVGAMERAARRMGKALDDMRDGEREDLEFFTRSIVDRILRVPLARLRAESAAGGSGAEALAMVEVTRSLFGLDDRVLPRATPTHAQVTAPGA